MSTPSLTFSELFFPPFISWQKSQPLFTHFCSFALGVSLRGKDTLSALSYGNNVALFSRSMTKASRFYWTQNINGNWSAWSLIGGSSVSLKTDVAVAYNSFSKVMTSLTSEISISSCPTGFFKNQFNNLLKRRRHVSEEDVKVIL